MVRKVNAKEPEYFALELESLRVLGGWCADCAEIALPAFEGQVPGDLRPRAAIEGIRVFAAGGKRTARLRTLALSALSAAREAKGPAAAAAARAASLAASSAYTHPLADVHQTKHVLGPAAYAALALGLDQEGNSAASEDVVLWAVKHAPDEVRDILRHMPSRKRGKSGLDAFLYAMDTGIRGGNASQGT